MALQMTDVTYRYKASQADVIKNLSFCFEEGKINAITGNSGSGKTTILMLLSALDLGYTGLITYKGKDIKKINQDIYRANEIGIVFQSYNLLFHATAKDNVKMGLYLAKETKKLDEKAAELLRKVGISSEKHNRKSLKLSGGEQQRVAIARSLTGNPSVIIADEPTGNLDETNRNTVMDIFCNISKDEGKTVIMSTHSTEVTKYAQNILRLQ